MGFVWTIAAGFIAGLVAQAVTRGRDQPSGFVLTTIVGIVGAVLATCVGQALGLYKAGGEAGLVWAIIGALVVLPIWSAVSRRRRP